MSAATTNSFKAPTNCEQVMKGEITEKYLLGQLDEADQEAFEQHYFECPRCFEELQTYRALQTELRQAGAAIRAEPLRGGLMWQRWAWVGGIAVMLLAIGLGVWLRQPAPGVQPSPPEAAEPAPGVEVQPGLEVPQQEPPPPLVPSLSELARVEPPRYIPARLRGAGDEATERFREAMQHYVKGDYGAAIPRLRAVAELNPKAADGSFFLGICYLLTDRTDAAIESLRRTVALGDSLYLEEAQFYLAKAYLRKGDLGAAAEELQKTIQLQGELESKAQGLLRKLQTLSKAAR